MFFINFAFGFENFAFGVGNVAVGVENFAFELLQFYNRSICMKGCTIS